MKKVMFVLVGLLLSFSVSAASLNLTTGSTTGFVTVNNSSIVDGFGYAHDTPVYVHDWDILTTDTDTAVLISVDFNPEDSGTSVSLWGNGSILSEVVGGDPISFIYNSLFVGVNYFIRVIGVAEVGSGSYHLTVSAVPIPAALWLFAPALIGLFGFRRKAAVAA